MAAKWALESWAPNFLSFLRFAISVVAGLFLIWVFPRLRGQDPRSDLIHAFVPGVLLGVETLFLMVSLSKTDISSGSVSANIYVVLVPIIAWLWGRSHLEFVHLVSVMIAITGLLLLNHQTVIQEVLLSDTFAALAGICIAFQIVSISRVVHRVKSLFFFNFSQCLWAALITGFVFSISTERPSLGLKHQALFGLLCLSLGSTFLTNLLLSRGQRYLTANLASLLSMFDVPFATVLGFWLLNERLDALQWMGWMMVVLAGVVASLFSSDKQKLADQPVEESTLKSAS